MSLEGDLSRCAFPDELVATHDEIPLLKRNTLWPRQDFVILFLLPEFVDPIFRQIMKAGLKRAIIHIQIEHSGLLQLGAYDNFYPKSVVTGPIVRKELLSELKLKKVLWDFEEPSATTGLSPNYNTIDSE